MLLAVDVGNTTTGVALFAADHLVNHWWLTTLRDRTADDLMGVLGSLFRLATLEPTEIHGVILCSVVPSQTEPWRLLASRYLGVRPLVVDARADAGIRLGYRFPEELGADRIVNAAAALHLYGAPAIVVDLGTATTFDVLNDEGEYVGGAIAPGVGIAAEALFERAARLPRVELARPPAAIGRSTAESVQSGLLFGYAGLIDALVRRISRELRARPRVVATGGLAEMVVRECETVDEINPLLTLEGLRLIFARSEHPQTPAGPGQPAGH